MAILIIVPDPEYADRLTRWAEVIASGDEPVEFICLDPQGNVETLQAVQHAVHATELKVSQIISLRNTAPVGEIMERLRKTKPRLMITSQFSFKEVGNIESEKQTSDDLVRSAPCTSIYPLSGKITPDKISGILMMVNQGNHDLATLDVATKLGDRLEARVTLATVENPSTSKAEIAGQIAIDSLIHDFGLEEDSIDTKVVVDRLRHRGIRTCLEDQELIVCGFDGLRDIRPLRESLEDRMVLIVKPASPLRLTPVDQWLPNINPRDHAELLQNLRQGSRWNKDFISMLALASAIASFGLLQDSPAVVIGSMLLAPLMTPMIGAGLALAQANTRLALQCSKTILMGIALAFLISFGVGLLTPSRETLSPEILSRGSPNVLDLLIALGAAIAATIAMARPSIANAVAGVAIATALVPPLCAVGLSVAAGQFANGLGALILFSTNLVAIIVASCFTFRLLGVVADSTLPRFRRFANTVQTALFVLLLLLAGPLSLSLFSQLDEGRPQTALFPVTRALSRALRDKVDDDKGVEIILMGRSSVTKGVFVYLASEDDLPRIYAEDIRKIVRETMHDPDQPVYVICLRGQWVALSDK